MRSVAREDLLNRVDNLFDSALFGQIARRARLEQPAGELVLGMHAHDQDRQSRVDLFDLLERFQPAPARHADIANDQVPIPFDHLPDQAFHIADFLNFGCRVLLQDQLAHLLLFPVPAYGAGHFFV